MKRTGLIMVALVPLIDACVMPMGPVVAPIAVDMMGPVSANSYSAEAKATKVGTSEAVGIVFLGMGDASIGAACESKGITKIHRVESKTTNILSIYAKYTTVVYGE